MLKDQHLEDERSAQDYHIRREAELTILIKVPDGQAAMMPEVWWDRVTDHPPFIRPCG